MNSLATDAVASPRAGPPETCWPVLRSRTSTETLAPVSAASATAWLVRAPSPSNEAVAGASGTSNSGARGVTISAPCDGGDP